MVKLVKNRRTYLAILHLNDIHYPITYFYIKILNRLQNLLSNNNIRLLLVITKHYIYLFLFHYITPFCL